MARILGEALEETGANKSAPVRHRTLQTLERHSKAARSRLETDAEGTRPEVTRFVSAKEKVLEQYSRLLRNEFADLTQQIVVRNALERSSKDEEQCGELLDK